MVFNNISLILVLDILIMVLLFAFGLGYAYYIFKHGTRAKYTYLSVVVGCLPIGIAISLMNINIALYLGAPTWIVVKAALTPWVTLSLAGVPMIIFQRVKWRKMQERYDQIKNQEDIASVGMYSNAGRRQHMS